MILVRNIFNCPKRLKGKTILKRLSADNSGALILP